MLQSKTYFMIQYLARKSSGSESCCSSCVVTGASATLLFLDVRVLLKII